MRRSVHTEEIIHAPGMPTAIAWWRRQDNPQPGIWLKLQQPVDTASRMPGLQGKATILFSNMRCLACSAQHIPEGVSVQARAC